MTHGRARRPAVGRSALGVAALSAALAAIGPGASAQHAPPTLAASGDRTCVWSDGIVSCWGNDTDAHATGALPHGDDLLLDASAVCAMTVGVGVDCLCGDAASPWHRDIAGVTHIDARVAFVAPDRYEHFTPCADAPGDVVTVGGVDAFDGRWPSLIAQVGPDVSSYRPDHSIVLLQLAEGFRLLTHAGASRTGDLVFYAASDRTLREYVRPITWGAPPRVLELPLGDVVQVAAVMGESQRRGCARTAAGTVWCWGENGCDVEGPTRPADPPAAPNTCIQFFTELPHADAIPLRRPAVDVGVGFHHACALLDDDTVWCWGSGYHRQLGDGARVDTTAPVRVRLPRRARSR